MEKRQISLLLPQKNKSIFSKKIQLKNLYNAMKKCDESNNFVRKNISTSKVTNKNNMHSCLKLNFSEIEKNLIFPSKLNTFPSPRVSLQMCILLWALATKETGLPTLKETCFLIFYKFKCNFVRLQN